MHIIIRATGLHFCAILQLQLTHRCKIREHSELVCDRGVCCNLRIGVKYEANSDMLEAQGYCCNLRISVKYEEFLGLDKSKYKVATYA